MKKYHKKSAKPSEQDLVEATAIAKGRQKPGQTKEQTKLIAQGIAKGIQEYKKNQAGKKRELDKELKKVKNRQSSVAEESTDHSQDSATNQNNSNWLPWTLLVLSWIGFILFTILKPQM